jgi:enediyne biosynthesis protein E4
VLALGAALAASVGFAQRNSLPQAKATSAKPTSSSPATGTNFVDVSRQAGLGNAIIVGGGKTTKKYLLEAMGGGVAFLDLDNDDWPDIFMVNGRTIEDAPEGHAPHHFLFHNNHDGTFRDVSEGSGLALSGWGQGVCAGDYNNDGHEDLYITNWGDNILFRNEGENRFEDATGEAHLPSTKGRWSTGCSFLDYDRDGNLDLFVGNYITFDFEKSPLPGDNYFCTFMSVPVACGPEGLGGGTNILYHNRGDGTFEDVSEKSGIANPRGVSTLTVSVTGKNWRRIGSYAFQSIAADFDNDGWPDIFVACDTAPSLLYHNNHDGTFTEVGVPAGAALSGQGVPQGGMGATVGDFNTDGWFDLARANFSGDPTTLYRNNGDGSFYDVSNASGLGANTKYVGMGVGFFDFDNDGREDLFVANGHVYPEADRIPGIIGFKQHNLLYRNLGNGRFQDVSSTSGPGLKVLGSSHGSAFADYDNDGDMDIIVTNNNEASNLLRNESGNRKNWIEIKLAGTRSNRSAIGARVHVVTGGQSQLQQVSSGSSFLSQNDLRLHFGLGTAKIVERLEIEWPSGAREIFPNVAANQFIRIREGKGELEKALVKPPSQ